MKVSIIIPVYNAEAQIKQALDSIFNQSYSNFEVILINDGSTDQSLNLCQQYAAKHENIVLVSIENSGPGYARNIGLAQVTGEYIAFVDADDALAPDFLEEMMRVAVENNVDIMSSTYYRVAAEIKEARTSFTTGIVNKQGSPEEQQRYHKFKTSSTFGYVWGKLYRTSFIEKYDIRFSEEKSVFLEDTLFNLKAIAFHPCYYVLNEPFYYYYVWEDSLSKETKDITERAIRLLEDYERFLKRIGKYEQSLDLLIPLANRVVSWSLLKTQENNRTLENIQTKVSCFSSNETVQRIMKNRQSFKEIRKIKSPLQILLYTFITFTIRHQLNKTVAIFFYVNGPLFSLYTKQAVQA